MSRITKQRKLSETAAMLAARKPRQYELWRTLPAEDFGKVRKLEVACHIGMFMSTIKEYRSAIEGDAACAARIAPRMVVPDEIDYPTGARTPVLLHNALRGSAGAALVTAHMLRKMPLDHEVKSSLATSWLVRNLLHARGGGRTGNGDRLPVRRSIAAELLRKSDSRS